MLPKTQPHSATHGSLFGIPASKSGNVLVDSVGAWNYWVRYRTFVEPRRSCSIEEFHRMELVKPRIKTRDRIKELPTNVARIVRVEVNTQEGLCLEKKKYMSVSSLARKN